MNLFAPAAKEIVLRGYQDDAVERLRDGIRQGRRRQILVAPTGAGKTVMAMHLVAESQKKGARSWFIVDRNALVDQTSASFAEYGIDHGIIQADHWLTDYKKPVQIISAHTLARRKIDELPALIIVDEAHTQYQKTLEVIQRASSAKVIGLTATPFTAGMAENWDGLVNSATTNQLLAMGNLSPLKIKACVSPDMTGAKKKFTGEYEDEEAGSRGITIIGDVVQTWVEQTRKHFGGSAKTIVFSPSVRHGAELCRQFADAGYNFQQISYLDSDDDDRRAKIAEFRKPNSVIDGLVSCAVLTKGFDVPDVKCIASGQRVLTDKGLVPIEKVTLAHKLWDGIEYVSHQGVIFKGYQHVIEHAGIVATADHEVHTAQGWRSLGDCAAKQIGITQTGFGERPVRWDAGHFAGDHLANQRQVEARACAMRVRSLWRLVCPGFSVTSHGSPGSWLSRLLSQARERTRSIRPAGVAYSARPKHESSVPKPITQGMVGLWRAGHRVSVRFGAVVCGMGDGEPWLAGAGSQYAVGQEGQRRSLRAWQPSLGVEGAELQQYAPGRLGSDDASVQDRASRNPLCGQDAAQPVRVGADVRSSGGEVLPAFGQAKRPVWDILQAGPRNRFTCEGLLVHNCGISCRPYRKSFSSHIQEMGRVMRIAPGKEYGLWLDHSGNCISFANDTAWLFEYGVDSLSDAAKRDSEVREPKEKVRKERFCAECGLQMGVGEFTCSGCGWERPERGEIRTIQGELIDFELEIGARFEPRKGLRADCLKDPRAIWNAALSYTSSYTSKGPDAAKKWAMGIWFGIYDGARPPRGFFDVKADPGRVQPDEYSLVEREVRRFRKSHKQARAA